jgi:RNA polymerase sigma-70 factor, ECF subfamily
MTEGTRNGGTRMGTDEALSIAALTGGDAVALAEHLFELHYGEVFAYLHRMVNDREWAQDLAQETFLTVYRKRDQIAALQNPRAWVYRVATNLALNALKRQRRFAWLPWEWHEGRANSADPAEAVSRQAQVEAALATLSPEHRAALLLYAHYGFKIAEVAEALNLSEGAARMRLQRARELFRQAYRKEDAS